jgi:hypothetical protein
MRLTINLNDELYDLIKEMAIAQNRTISKQVNHLAQTSPETIGWRTFKSNPKFQELLNATPVGLGK